MFTSSKMEEKELEELYNKLKTLCLSNVLNRVTEESMDEDNNKVDITRIKKELNSFRHREIDEPGTKSKTEGKLTYYLLVRKLESFAAEHLKKYVMSIDKDTISISSFSKDIKKLDIDSPIPNMAPDLPTKVVATKEKDNTGKKDAIQLTTGDSIKKRFQTTLILKTAKDGTLYEARSKICYKLTSDNHYVAIGKFDNDYKKQKLSDEDIAQVKADGYPYLNEFGNEENYDEDVPKKSKKDKEEDEESVDKKKASKKQEKKTNKKSKKDDEKEDVEEKEEKVEEKKPKKKKGKKDVSTPKKTKKGKTKKVDKEEDKEEDEEQEDE